MKQETASTATAPVGAIAAHTVYSILFTISFTHLLNDLVQSVIPAVYPIIKQNFKLTYAQVGIITFTFQLTASVLQPFVGLYTDKKPQPFSLAVGTVSTLSGLMLLALASHFAMILLAVALIGIGSSIFHPESSRVAYLASGGKKRTGTIYLSIGWQCRQCPWAFAGRIYSSAVRTV